MYSFFVLGQIPGTSIIISFGMWLETGLLLVGLAALYTSVHSRHLRIPVLLPTISND